MQGSAIVTMEQQFLAKPIILKPCNSALTGHDLPLLYAVCKIIRIVANEYNFPLLTAIVPWAKDRRIEPTALSIIMFTLA